METEKYTIIFPKNKNFWLICFEYACYNTNVTRKKNT